MLRGGWDYFAQSRVGGKFFYAEKEKKKERRDFAIFLVFFLQL